MKISRNGLEGPHLIQTADGARRLALIEFNRIASVWYLRMYKRSGALIVTKNGSVRDEPPKLQPLWIDVTSMINDDEKLIEFAKKLLAEQEEKRNG